MDIAQRIAQLQAESAPAIERVANALRQIQADNERRDIESSLEDDNSPPPPSAAPKRL